MDFPLARVVIPPLHLYSASRYTCFPEYAWLFGPAGSTINWDSANRIYYIPLVIPFYYPVRRAFWLNGASPSASQKLDLGIYTFDGALIYNTGLTAQSGASQLQYVTVSQEILLAPGRYWIAIMCDSSSLGNFFAFSNTDSRTTGVMQQAGSAGSGLPATMTPVSVTGAMFPLCGFTRTTSGF